MLPQAAQVAHAASLALRNAFCAHGDFWIRRLCSHQPAFNFAGETRFATAFIMLQRLVEVKQGLEETVVARDWKEWLEGQPSALNDEADNIKSSVSNSAQPA
jgi:hypothetical protein